MSEADTPVQGARPTDARPILPDRAEEGLDPATAEEWDRLRALAHRMVDDVLDYQRTLRDRPAWQPVPDAVRAALSAPAPHDGQGAEAAYDAFLKHVRPYPYGNIHPRAWGWVNGQGDPVTVLAEMLAAMMNPNTWGGEHGAAYVEAQVIAWLRSLLGFPADASGVLTSGGSVATLIGLACARDAAAVALRGDAGRDGVRALDADLVVYGSEETHNAVEKACAILGLGRSAFRRIRVDARFRVDLDALEEAMAEDRAAGRRPMCVVGNAGTVNTGAIDDLGALADLCEREAVWFHVDGAIGAVAALSSALRPQLAGMERADSLAFDLHKWLFAPIEAGCVLVRSAVAHRRPFTPRASYLEAFDRGVSSGPHNFAALGPQLTRGFRALKLWLGLTAHGVDRYGRIMEQNVRQARRLEALVRTHPRLELLAPVPLCIVCFRYVPGSAMDEPAIDELNRELLLRLQESGEAVVSSTVLPGGFALRAAITNHRTRSADIDAVVDAVVRLGQALESEA